MSLMAQSNLNAEPKSKPGHGHFKLLPEDREDKARKPLKICLIMPEARGLPEKEKKSFSFEQLGRDLRDSGHKIIYLHSEKKKNSKASPARDLKQVFIPSFSSFNIKAPLYISRAYKIYLWLKDQDFDVIYYPDRGGLGHYISMAKRQGLAFRHTALCAVLLGPGLFLKEALSLFPKTVNELGVDFMESESIASSDVAITFNEDIYLWMIKQTWAFPKAAYMQKEREKDKSLFKRQNWLSWYEDVHLKADVKPKAFIKDTSPLVSVCMPHHNRPDFLDQAIGSLEAQDYPNFEVILVDDGSTDKKALRKLDELEHVFKKKKWQIIRQKNLWQGAAINKAAQYAKGEYLMLMDDDNIASPFEISTFVSVAERTRADILTCFLDTFKGNEPPKQRQKPDGRYLFIGPAISVGAFHNGFGDNNALIRREVFLALGGFSEIYGVGHTDWEFFARAVLKKYYLEVIPEALFKRRVTGKGMLKTTDLYQNTRLSLEPYLSHMPSELKEILLLAHGMSQTSKK